MLTVLTEYAFSVARSNLTEVIDRAQKMAPVVIRSRKKSEEPSIVLSASLLRSLTDANCERVEIRPEFSGEADGSLTIELVPLDIVVNGPDRPAAVAEVVREAVEYAREYLDPENIALYLRAPNRRSHLSLMIRLALCESHAEVAELLHLA